MEKEKNIMGKKDIVRHKLVTRIVNAYEAYDKKMADGMIEERKNKRVKKSDSDKIKLRVTTNGEDNIN